MRLHGVVGKSNKKNRGFISGLGTVIAGTQEVPHVNVTDAKPVVEATNTVGYLLLLSSNIIGVKSYVAGNCDTDSRAVVKQKPKVKKPSIKKRRRKGDLIDDVSKKGEVDSRGKSNVDIAGPEQLQSSVVAEEKPHKCQLCDMKFKFASRLKRHTVHAHCVEKPYECEICHQKFSWRFNMKKHHLNHIAEKAYECSNLSIMPTTDQPKPDAVDHCDEESRPVIKQELNVDNEEQVHDCETMDVAASPCECEKCGLSFAVAADLMEHECATHGSDNKLHKCTMCNMTYKFSRHLKKHSMDAHSTDKPYECDICHQMFSWDYNMKKHKLIHSVEKAYTCFLCNESFRDVSKLSWHMNTLKHLTFKC